MSVKRRLALQKRIRSGSASCILKQVKTGDRLVSSIVGDAPVTVVDMDILAVDTAPSPGAYIAYLQKLYGQLYTCISQ